MYDHIFENRDRKLSNLLRLGDYLGRSLRENTVLFSIDDKNARVSYLTESKKIVSGDYSFKDGIKFDFIVVEDFDLYSDENKFDNLIDNKISLFVESLYTDNFPNAQSSFSDILESWESRFKFDTTRRKLQEKSIKFNDSNDILSTPEFHNFVQLAPDIAEFLQENSDSILEIPEIVNGIKLSNTVAKAFNIKRLNYITLEESGTFRVSDTNNKSIYEMICRQELVKKELLESKSDFNASWATSKKVKALAGLLYEENHNKIQESLGEAIEEVPYLAFVSKKSLGEAIESSLMISESVEIPEVHIKKYVSTLFEMKKPVKEELLSILNEKYGINVQNLKEVPSFKSLINTQVVVLETLARVSPKKSIQKKVIREFVEILKGKSGVQSLDVNDCLKLIFESANISSLFEDEELINQWSDDSYSADVEDSLETLTHIEYEDSEDSIEEEEGEQEAEEGEETPQEPDPMEEDPEEEEEEAPAEPEEEISKEDFKEAMKDLEDLLSDISPKSGPLDDSDE